MEFSLTWGVGGGVNPIPYFFLVFFVYINSTWLLIQARVCIALPKGTHFCFVFWWRPQL